MRRTINPGSTLRLGGVSVRFDGAGAGGGPSTPEGTATIARRLVSDLFQSRSQGEPPRLVSLAGAPLADGLPLSLPLAIPDRSYLVGRGETCDLVLPSEEISREHAVVVRRWEGVHIRDLGSKNGVRVGGQPIVGDHRLRDGDRLEIGALSFSLDDPEDRYLRQIESAPDDAPRAIASGAPPAEAVARPVPRRRRVNAPFILAAVVLVAVAIAACVLIFSVAAG